MGKAYLLMEVPVAHLDDLDPLIDGHFVIASELLKNKEYLDWYITYGQRPSDQRSMVMLDNGAFEAGEPVSAKDLIELAIKINAGMVWAPDVLHNKDETIRRTVEFYEALPGEISFGIGIIPQGKTAEEIIECYKFLGNLFYFDLVGLSFRNPREHVWEHIEEPIHMLGLRDTEEIKTWPVNTLSMDTVKPFKAAFHNKPMNDARGLPTWNTEMKLDCHDARLMDLYRNIALLHTKLTR